MRPSVHLDRLGATVILGWIQIQGVRYGES